MPDTERVIVWDNGPDIEDFLEELEEDIPGIRQRVKDKIDNRRGPPPNVEEAHPE